MNRLTRHGKKNKDWVLLNKICSKANGNFCPHAETCNFVDNRTCPYLEALDKLAAYEDTGLTPELCAEYKTFEDEVVSKGVSFKRIIELMEADKEGRCVVLPCKVGDTVYWATTADEIPCIFKGAIYNFSVDNTEGRLWVYVKYHNGLNYHHPVDEDFGKDVFLTRSEAESALKTIEREGKD